MKPPTQLKRRQFLKNVTTIAGAAGALQLAGVSATLRAYGQGAAKPKPVILTTDIGDDIDDTWALGLLLKSPELDLKLVLGDFGKSQYRSKLLGKFLQTVHHAGVPIGIGIDTEPRGDGPQAGWLKDYELSSYAGKVRQDGVQALIDVVMKSPEPVTIIAIGPMPNVAAALEREPKIAERARLVGMYGSVRRGYEGNKNVSAEWNVKAAVKACQKHRSILAASLRWKENAISGSAIRKISSRPPSSRITAFGAKTIRRPAMPPKSIPACCSTPSPCTSRLARTSAGWRNSASA